MLFWIAVAAVIIAAATVFNVSRVVCYSRSDTELKSQASRDEARAADLVAAATKLRASVDAAQVEAASAEARLANDLISRRTFSWTLLLNQLEATLPPNVRITGRPPHRGGGPSSRSEHRTRRSRGGRCERVPREPGNDRRVYRPPVT